MKFLKSTLTSFLNNMFGLVIQFITLIVTSRILGPNGSGVWGIATTVIGSALIVFGLGIPASNVYYIGKDRKNIDTVIGVNFIVTLIATIGIFIVYLLNMKFNFPFFKGLSGYILLIVIMTVPINIIKTSLYYILLGIEEVTNYNKVNMLDRAVSFVFLVVFLVIFKTAKWVIIANFLSSFAMVLVIFYILFAQRRYKIAISMDMFKRMMSYGLKAQLSNGVQFINYRLDVFVTNAYLTTTMVGLYTRAASIGETMWKVSQSVGIVVLPLTANTKDTKQITDFLNKVIRITFAFVLICAIGLTIISKPVIVLLLSKKFLGSVVPFMLLIPGISIFAINNILGNYFSGAGLIGKNIIASTISGIITVILDFTLIPIYGINGAAITSSISYTVCTIISLYFYKKHTGSKLYDILVIKKSDIAEIKLKLSSYRKSKGA